LWHHQTKQQGTKRVALLHSLTAGANYFSIKNKFDGLSQHQVTHGLSVGKCSKIAAENISRLTKLKAFEKLTWRSAKFGSDDGAELSSTSRRVLCTIASAVPCTATPIARMPAMLERIV
jgi:hypothetical protein